MKKRKSKYVSYERCKMFAQSLDIRTMKEWQSLPLPKNMPKYPQFTYVKKGWVNWYEFLGKPKGSNKKEYMSYEEAENWIRKKGIKSIQQFRNAKRIPYNFPSQPDVKYRGNGWKSWMHFFGKLDANGEPDKSQGMRSYRKTFLSYQDARKYMIEKGIQSRDQFEKMNRRPSCIPSQPATYYKEKGWISWCDFFGKEHKLGRPKKDKVLES